MTKTSTPKPLTPKQRQALGALASGKPVSAPRLGGLRVADALVKRGFAEQGKLVVTAMQVGLKGTTATLQPSFSITDAGLVELGLRQ